VAGTRPVEGFNGRIETMTENNATVMPVAAEVVAVKRGRKPGQLIWTFDKVIERITIKSNMVDAAKFAWLNTTYKPNDTTELTALQIMILADHSKVKELWTASDEFQTVTAKVDELRAEAEAAKSAAELKVATSSVTVETLMAALTPEQIAAIIAAATAK